MFKLLTFKLYIALTITWLSLSGYLTPFFIIAGLGSSLFVVIFTRYLHCIVEAEITQNTLRKGYLFWLSYQIITASLSVIKLIWQPQPTIRPGFVEISHLQQHDQAITVLANSITLTPGTVTCCSDRTDIVVHLLFPELIQGLQSMRTKVTYSFT